MVIISVVGESCNWIGGAFIGMNINPSIGLD